MALFSSFTWYSSDQIAKQFEKGQTNKDHIHTNVQPLQSDESESLHSSTMPKGQHLDDKNDISSLKTTLCQPNDGAQIMSIFSFPAVSIHFLEPVVSQSNLTKDGSTSSYNDDDDFLLESEENSETNSEILPFLLNSQTDSDSLSTNHTSFPYKPNLFEHSPPDSFTFNEDMEYDTLPESIGTTLASSIHNSVLNVEHSVNSQNDFDSPTLQFSLETGTAPSLEHVNSFSQPLLTMNDTLSRETPSSLDRDIVETTVEPSLHDSQQISIPQISDSTHNITLVKHENTGDNSTHQMTDSFGAGIDSTPPDDSEECEYSTSDSELDDLKFSSETGCQTGHPDTPEIKRAKTLLSSSGQLIPDSPPKKSPLQHILTSFNHPASPVGSKKLTRKDQRSLTLSIPQDISPVTPIKFEQSFQKSQVPQEIADVNISGSDTPKSVSDLLSIRSKRSRSNSLEFINLEDEDGETNHITTYLTKEETSENIPDLKSASLENLSKKTSVHKQPNTKSKKRDGKPKISVSLRDVITHGFLQTGDIVSTTHSGSESVFGILQPDGTIQVEGQQVISGEKTITIQKELFTSPSKFATSIAHSLGASSKTARNGWNCVKSNNKFLKYWRQQTIDLLTGLNPEKSSHGPLSSFSNISVSPSSIQQITPEDSTKYGTPKRKTPQQTLLSPGSPGKSGFPSIHSPKTPAKSKTKKRLNTNTHTVRIMVSGLSRLFRAQVREAAIKFGGDLVTKFDPVNPPTHLVTAAQMVPKSGKIISSGRTMKYLQSVLAGIWIVSTGWIAESLEMNKWADPTPFEVQGDPSGSGGPEKSRLYHTSVNEQISSMKAKLQYDTLESRVKPESFPRISQKTESVPLPELFNGLSFYFLGSFPETGPTLPVLKSLITLGGCSNILSRYPLERNNDIIVIASNKVPISEVWDAVHCLNSKGIKCDNILNTDWILDSISCYSQLPRQNYQMKNNNLLESETENQEEDLPENLSSASSNKNPVSCLPISLDPHSSVSPPQPRRRVTT